MESQASFAVVQLFPAEGVDFAFVDAKVSCVQMLELSGVEETKGPWLWEPPILINGPFDWGNNLLDFYAPLK